MSTWECLLYALVCCLGSHTLEWPVGGVFIAPNTKLAVGEKLLLSAAHRTVRWCTGQCIVHFSMHLAIGLTPQVTVGVHAFYTGHFGRHTGHSGGLLSTVPPGTSRWATVPSCTRQSACGTGQFGVPPDSLVLQTKECRQHFLCFLDFS
jgi:hypothetical protein